MKIVLRLPIAHQPSLLTGPLYYIYKIFSAINLAEALSVRFPNNHFVPVWTVYPLW
ncbi:MAG: bacillithiol biosynthesis BshC [Saprospiraceae bacterium]|nr:bacillithiol biosynthesis BshC [Saprospiraceae bacterium]